MFNKNARTESPEAEQAQAADGNVVTEEMPVEGSDTATEAPLPEAQAGSSESDEWKRKYDNLYDQFVRLSADFDNYRKRVREEQEGLVRYGAQKSVLELLPVLDNLDRANSSLNENSDPQVLYKSFSLMQKQLLDGLDAMGVKKIQAVGQPFDPQFHEAVSQMESTEFPEHTVMFEAQSGYMLHDKVIRPAKVVVSTGSSDGAAESAPAAPEEEGQEAARNNPFIK